MSTEPEEVEVPGVEERPRLLSVEIGDWPGLGGNVGFTLGERRTVLVGRNGAGKSLLMEGVWRAVGAAAFGPEPGFPRFFRCEVAIPGTSALQYEYRMGSEDAGDKEPHALDSKRSKRRRIPSWSERCWRSDDGAELWRIADGTIVQQGAGPRPFQHGEGLLITVDADFDGPGEVLTLADFLAGFDMVPAGVPRSGGDRREIVVRGSKNEAGTHDWSLGPDPNVGFAGGIVHMWEHDTEQFEELVELLRDLDLVRNVKVELYEGPQAVRNAAEHRTYATVLFDGVNFGLCSDGTQRVTSILRQLIREDLSCLLVEEPETAVHPRLLGKLLGVIESYSFDRQVVLSTHSPEVVDWCGPTGLRIVERLEGQTQVHGLGSEELARVHRYLADEGTFSDFVYRWSEA
ncbi:AAA family ATPase [Polyangium aurulentum]|uniref:AAA family ATPase n=1 Tax=Polyangium aurulentum TaxID=2567896 RepID=UPI0010AE7EBD|nr:ATP-binding protein [Polyangium aurulentum]UQA54616.1 ATP-binding protein [Polyangium aurulentum]